MSEEVEDIRGRQITIGKSTIIVPIDGPITDDDVIVHEELIDEITKASAPARRCVKSADKIVKLLQKDIAKALRDRDDTKSDADEAPLFFIGTEPVVTEDETDIRSRHVIRRLMRMTCVRGWQKEVATLAAEGATDQQITDFLSRQAKEPLGHFVGQKEMAFVGGENPGIYSIVQDFTEKKGKPAMTRKQTPELVGYDVVLAMREAFKIPTPIGAEIRQNLRDKSKKRTA